MEEKVVDIINKLDDELEDSKEKDIILMKLEEVIFWLIYYKDKKEDQE